MGPVLVVVPAVDAEHVFEMAAAEDEDPVEAVGADGSHPAFGVGVRVGRLHGRADHVEALGVEDLIERTAELRVAIVDQKSEGLVTSELHDEVARLLGGPGPTRIRGAGDVLDPSRRQRDEEQHVDPLQEGSLDREEVTRERTCSMLVQERPPRRARPLRRRLKTACKQHLAHRGRRDGERRGLSARQRSCGNPSGDSLARDEGSACAATAQAVAAPAPWADTSTVERPAGDASEAACPA